MLKINLENQNKFFLMLMDFTYQLNRCRISGYYDRGINFGKSRLPIPLNFNEQFVYPEGVEGIG